MRIANLLPIRDLLPLFLPHHCETCGSDVLGSHQFLCSRCQEKLPVTGFLKYAGNPVEKLFYGRCRIQQAGALYYFTKDSLLQHILFALKYREQKDAGYFLGRMIGYALQKTDRFDEVDCLIPLPLHPRKENRRGYNQANLIAAGIVEVWRRPLIPDAMIRTRFTESQTQRNRIDRWQHMQDVFSVAKPDLLNNRHLLLVDDVVTTGASLEACAKSLLSLPNTRVSIVTAAYTL
ncbi:MAG: ComF family protein [Bacteroidota bacterium]|nr:ComF family protein [Bacteroidota bacterium]